MNIEAKLYVPVSTSWTDTPVRFRLGAPFARILRRGKDLAGSPQVRAWHLNFDATECVRVEPIHSYRMLVLKEDQEAMGLQETFNDLSFLSGSVRGYSDQFFRQVFEAILRDDR